VRNLARRMQHEGREIDFGKYETSYGYEVASRIWQRACDSFDWHNAPEEFADGKPSEAVIY